MSTTDTIKQTPLHDKHLALGARMAPFAGFDMPVQYDGIVQEHLAVRRKAGIFDVSHMGEVLVRGPHATEYAQRLVTNDVESLYDGRALYTVMCREDGGIVDDLIVYRIDEETYLFVINAANREKDLDWMIQNNAAKADIDDISDDVALIAVQGPEALDVVGTALGEPVGDLKFYHFRTTHAGPLSESSFAILSRTGYTGEPGVEIYCNAEAAPKVWEAIMEAGTRHGLQAAGLGARDTLRIEAGYCLYGNDITEDTNPIEAGLGWLTKLGKDDFVGKEAITAISEGGPARKLVAFVLQERGIPRSGYPVLSAGEEEIGVVTSGTQSPILQQGIGLGYVANNPDFVAPGSKLVVSIRGRAVPALVQKPPLHTPAS